MTLSNALSGLIAALTAEEQLEEAELVASSALPVLAGSAILIARADILAWLMARLGRFEVAARLIGASDNFRAGCETARDLVEQRCRQEALAILSASVREPTQLAWVHAGACASEEELVASLSASLRPGAAKEARGVARLSAVADASVKKSS